MAYEVGVGLQDKLGSLFQQDTLSSAQYFETFRRKSLLEPEKRLMLAVLEEAIVSFQKYLLARDCRRRRMSSEAEVWILEEDNGWLFSFQNLCEVLGFNPQYIR